MNEPAHSVHDKPDGQPASDTAVARVFVICNKKGLHARASAKFVQTVEKFDANVRVKRCGDNNETVGQVRRFRSRPPGVRPPKSSTLWQPLSSQGSARRIDPPADLSLAGA
jgi:hypothetical protein